MLPAFAGGVGDVCGVTARGSDESDPLDDLLDIRDTPNVTPATTIAVTTPMATSFDREARGGAVATDEPFIADSVVIGAGVTFADAGGRAGRAFTVAANAGVGFGTADTAET